MSSSAAFVIGIDLGTTNCALAYANLADADASGVPRVRRLSIPQLVAEGEIGNLDTLPSFLYLAAPEERASGRFDLPWAPAPDRVTGVWARDEGALRPGRLVASAKSWLCHPAVDRHAPILPWDADPAERVCSPVDASAAYLAHLRDVWNHGVAAGVDAWRFERQDIVLTVPASFDEEARELTVEAARSIGVEALTLQEEPTAALHAWIASHRTALGRHLRDGDTILVCDVGGGTTDFTLVIARARGDDLAFERVAVGDHLLLGGDNLDVALARDLEAQIGGPVLTMRQRQALRRQTSAAKERLLAPEAPARVTLSVLGAGGSVIGGARTAVLDADLVRRTLEDGFLPVTALAARPAQAPRSGLRELGLPYEPDPAMTRHLAAFLVEAGGAADPVRPDVVILNGGFFAPAVARDRMIAVIRRWFERPGGDWTLRVLANESPATAVAEGAAAYGLVRRGFGLPIGGGSPRVFYVGIQAPGGGEDSERVRAVCVLPRGTEEGTRLAVASDFEVVANRPRAFSLWSSRTRRDALGDVVSLVRSEVHGHAPLVAELRYGKRSRSATLPVRLEVAFTEVGTLELWLAARETDHRWRLRFELRGASQDRDASAGGETAAIVDAAALDRARAAVVHTFGPSPDGAGLRPEELPGTLETALGLGRHAWPVAAIRPVADALLEHAAGRHASTRHEARWLNLVGFCLRPGFGATLDDWRMSQTRRVYLAGLGFPSDVQCQAEWLVLWQRLAGGLSAGQQQDVYQRYGPPLAASLERRGKRLPPQVERETWRLLASLERLSAKVRSELGDRLVARLEQQRDSASLWWALGRVAARTPVYGPLDTVVPPARAAAWLERVMGWELPALEALSALVDVAALTGDAARDLEEALRAQVEEALQRAGAPPHLAARLRDPLVATRADLQRRYGESLPEGLALAGAGGALAYP
jgi:molecular chaperone DnaK (HSP70)